MGRASEEYLRLMESGLTNVPDKFICVKHLNNKFIQSFIRKNSEQGYCSYCNKSLKVIKLQELLEFMMECIKKQYGDAAEHLPYVTSEGGYIGETLNNYELLEELSLEIENETVLYDIVNSIVDYAWTDGYKYNNERYDMISSWDIFKNEIIHKSRFFFHPKLNSKSNEQPPYNILLELGQLISKFYLVKTISQDEILFRCRQHSKNEDVKDVSSIVSPPNKFANTPNRFSPVGISMFYGAYDIETAKMETINLNDASLDNYTIGKLKIGRSIKVLDITKIPATTSIFNPSKYIDRYKLDFIKDLRNDLMKGISRDGKEHLEYIPTQVVTEFLKFDFNKRRQNKIEGILYNSSKDNKECLVLFWDNEECIKNMELIEINTYSISSMLNKSNE